MNEDIDSIREKLIDVRESVRDQSLSLLSDAVYRKDENAKSLERQCAKISRAIDKAIHECDVLERLTSQTNDSFID